LTNPRISDGRADTMTCVLKKVSSNVMRVSR
jgi:hypothetical protein